MNIVIERTEITELTDLEPGQLLARSESLITFIVSKQRYDGDYGDSEYYLTINCNCKNNYLSIKMRKLFVDINNIKFINIW